MALMMSISPLAAPTLGMIISMLSFLYCCTSSTSFGSRSCTSLGVPVAEALGTGAGVALDLFGADPLVTGAASGEDTALLEEAGLIGATLVELGTADPVAVGTEGAAPANAGVGVDDSA